MATVRSLDSFNNSSTGLFKNNSAGDISAQDLRDFVASIMPTLRGHIDGLTLSNNGTDANHDIDIAIGVCTGFDGVDAYVPMELTSILTKQIDASWAVGDDAGGLDAGSVAADTWYHVYLIMRSDTGVVDALFSTNASAPTMPTNYDYKRRIGAIKTDGSSDIKAFTQIHDDFIVDPAKDLSVTTSATSLTLVTLGSIPTGVEVEIWAKVGGQNTSASWPFFWHGNAAVPTNENWGPTGSRNMSTSSNFAQFNNIRLWTNTSAQVYYAATASTHDTDLYVHGWTDPRGKNS